MKMERTYPRAIVTKKQTNRIHDGHPWVYEDEIVSQEGNITNGCLIDVFGSRDNYLGTGFYSEQSKIRIRLLSRNANDVFDHAFWARRVKYALQYRLDVMADDFRACRLIHGESDELPGLTVDRYEDILVSEVASYGMEQVKGIIYQELIDQLAEKGEVIHGIYERNEGELRKKEGLPQYKGWYGEKHPASPIVHIHENGIEYEVDVENGQKTGFFLDQKYNRLAVRHLAKGRTVLDCCTHTGSFAMNAVMGGAKHVTAMDISQEALDMAEKNAVLNHIEDKMDFLQGDVFEVLPELRTKHAFFDLIILDPPAFTKSRKTYGHARSGYTSINAMTMKLLPRGGYLATCSCSHFMPTEAFKDMLKDAAKEAGVQVRIVEERHASMDHPVLVSVPETDYLKYFLVQII
ncbi:MAG: class I SAM-dependent rRNA methyltransferase [Erysipelotrichaceae bacterium]|nr:class I SAM-dependent rRNA methyltransferase [Erysipelotrichaceae bacterium]